MPMSAPVITHKHTTDEIANSATNHSSSDAPIDHATASIREQTAKRLIKIIFMAKMAYFVPEFWATYSAGHFK